MLWLLFGHIKGYRNSDVILDFKEEDTFLQTLSPPVTLPISAWFENIGLSDLESNRQTALVSTQPAT